MILDIDAGNTRIKWRIIDGGETLFCGELSTESVAEGAPIEIDVDGVVERIRLCSVAGDTIISSLQKQLQSRFNVAVELAEVSAEAAGVTCGYKDFNQLGVDRWLALIAAYQKYAKPIIVVDAGTAVTIDIVDEDGLHLGGYIIPGLNLMHQSLWKGTEQIKVALKPVADIANPGTSTDQAVDRGCLLMLVAMIESLVGRYQCLTVITGGDGQLLQEQLTMDTAYFPDLVMDGLAEDGISFRALG